MARAPRGPVSTTIGDMENRPLLRFDKRQEALNFRLAEFASQPRSFLHRSGAPAPVTGGDGLSLNASLLLNAAELARATTDRTLRAAINKIMRNAAKRALDKVRALSRPTYETGAFMSNWAVDLADVGGGLKLRMSLRNPVPYSLYVHRKGTGPTRTVVNTYVIPYVREQLQREIIEDLSSKLSAPLKRQLFGA
jgi:hypothetical protein